MHLPTNSGVARAVCLATAVFIVMIAGCETATPDFEYVYLPGTEIGSGANLPFTPAIKVRGGNIVFLSGITGAPVPHSHPHIPSEFDHLDFDAAAQTEAIMERLQETLRAAGGELGDVVQITRFISCRRRQSRRPRPAKPQRLSPTHRIPKSRRRLRGHSPARAWSRR